MWKRIDVNTGTKTSQTQHIMKIVIHFILSFLSFCTVTAQNFIQRNPTNKTLPETVQKKIRNFKLLPHQYLDYAEKRYLYTGTAEDGVIIYNPLPKEILINKEDSLIDDSALMAERGAKHFFPDSAGSFSLIYFDRLRYPLGNTIRETYLVSKGRLRKLAERISDGIASRYFDREMNIRLDSFKLQHNQFLQYDTAEATISLCTTVNMIDFKLPQEEMPQYKKEILRIIYEILHEEVYKYKKLVIYYLDKTGIGERVAFIFETEKSDVTHRYEELKAKYLKIFHNGDMN